MGNESKALQLLKNKEYDEAAKLLIELMETEKEEPRHFTNFGKLLFQMKQYEEAERFFLKSIELDETFAEAFNGLGNLDYETSLYDDAVKVLHHAIKLGLNDSDVFFMLGMSYVQKDNITLSLPYLQRSAELSNEVEKIFQYGLSLAKLGYMDEAKVQLEHALKMDPQHSDVLYNLGVIAVHHQNVQEAIHYFNETIAIQPSHTLAVQAKEEAQQSME